MKITLILFSILLSIKIYSQEKIRIEYEFRNEFDLDIDNSQLKEIYKNSNQNKIYFELLTSKNESIFEIIEKIDNSQDRTGTYMSYTSAPNGMYYKNFSDQISLVKTDYKGKEILLYDSIKSKNWILEKETKKILGLNVKKAIYKQTNNTNIEAWYSPELIYRNGPYDYDGLPGLILELIIINTRNNKINKEIYTAVDLNYDDKIKINKPIKGKKISKINFDLMIEEENKKFIESLNNIVN